MLDRDRLQASLRDYRRGKGSHLPPSELASLLANIKKRIADVEQQIKKTDDA